MTGAGTGAIAKLTGVSSIACFTAGTPVVMADGTTTPIEQVKAGDRVQAWNPDTNSYEAREVVDTYAHQHVATRRITTSDGEIVSTGEHPFHLQDHGWTPVNQLRPGDVLHGHHGQTVTVQTVGPTGQTATVHNLHVAGLHTYQITTTTGTPTTVHNDCGTGKIDYGELDSLGRPIGVTAEITPDMIGTGTLARSYIRPKGFLGGGVGHSRGHLLAAQLCGSGCERRNLVTIFQNPANTPVMRGFETDIRQAIEIG